MQKIKISPLLLKSVFPGPLVFKGGGRNHGYIAVDKGKHSGRVQSPGRGVGDFEFLGGNWHPLKFYWLVITNAINDKEITNIVAFSAILEG